MNQDISFGSIIKEYRKTHDLTQAELARRVGCATITVRKIEADALRPSVQIAERLAMTLNVPLDERAKFVRLARTATLNDPSPSPLPTPPLVPDEVGLEDLSGRAIRGYELGERLAMGGFGAVYRSVQPLLDREVAIKIILPQYANHPEFIRRFEAEAQLVARLEHPYIVPLYDFWREPGVAYLVMRLMRGGSLHSRLKNGPLRLEASVRLLQQVGAALHSAHRVGVVHRDIKPANILLDEEDNAYLADFGFAKNLGNPNLEEHTQDGAVVGSLEYISPEQIQAEPVRPQADIYCLGITLYEMLTAHKPFKGPTPIDYIQQHLREPLPPLAAAQNDSPDKAALAALDPVIARATHKNPDRRYPDVSALLDDVRHSLSNGAAVVTATGKLPSTIFSSPAAALENPYKGLHAFGEADADNFFGRDSLTQELLGRLSETNDLTRFLAVVGPSGSGKSSLVKAGLIPALRRGGLPGSEHWFIVDFMPGAHPLEELEVALLRVAANPPDNLLAQLRESERGLLRTLKRILPADDSVELVLVIDQFEELFTLTDDGVERAHFLGLLVTALLDARSRLRLIITLRADFTDRPLQYLDFGEIVRQRTEFVLPLSPDELEQAITQPATRLGLTWEAGLVTTIINDVGDQPGTLPLLQYALTELFERRDGRRLTLAAYQAGGGVLGTLAHRAEEIYAGLNESEQELTRQLFLRLVTPGEGAEDIRRRVLRSELLSLVTRHSSLAGETSTTATEQRTPDKGQLTIDIFGKHRLLTFDRDPVSRAPTVEIAHEALIREWDRLRNWLADSRADIRLQRLLAAAAHEWIQANRDPGFLLYGSRLDQFEGWAESSDVALTQDERTFLEVSLVARQERQAAEEARLQRELETAQKLAETEHARAEEQSRAAAGLRQRALWLAGVSAVAVLLAMAAGLFGVQSSRNAQEAQANAQLAATREAQALAAEATAVAERERADAERDAAISRRLAIEVEDQIDSGNFDTALLLAIEAARVDENPETWQSLRRAVVQPNPLISIFSGHTAAISEVEGAKWNAAEDRILTNSEDGTTRVWDVESGEELLILSAGQGEWFPFAAWNSDETQILTGGTDGVGRVWDAETGEELLSFGEHTDFIWHAAWSPDERMILTASDDGTTGVWDAETGRQIQLLTGHTDYIFSAMWNGDGSRILTGSLDGTARVWDAAGGEELLSLAADEDGVTEAVWNDDETLIVTTGYDHTAKLWDAETGALLQTFSGHTDFVWRTVWSQDESRILTVSGDGTARVWDVETGRQLLALTGHEEWINQAVWSPDETSIATASDDASVRIWDAQTGTELAVLGHQDGVMSVAWNAEGDTILTGDGSGQARIWAWDSFEPQFELPALRGNAGNYWQATWNAAENLILTASDDSAAYLRIWNADTGQPHMDFDGHSAAVRQAWWSRDESRILSASEDGTARIWDAQTGEELLAFAGHTDAVLRASWNKDETRVLSAGDDGVARIWDAATGQERLALTDHDGRVWQASWNAAEDRILTASDAGFVRIWDADTGEELLTFSDHTDGVLQAKWNSAESQILTYSKDGTARVWDGTTGDTLLVLDGHPDGATVARWNTDETRILTAGIDGVAKLWDAKTGELLQTFSGHTAPIWDAAWNRDESQIATVGEEGLLLIWDARTGARRVAIQDNRALQTMRWNENEDRILAVGIQGVRQYYTRLEDMIAVGCRRVTRNLTEAEWAQFFGEEPYQATCPDLAAR